MYLTGWSQERDREQLETIRTIHRATSALAEGTTPIKWKVKVQSNGKIEETVETKETVAEVKTSSPEAIPNRKIRRRCDENDF